MFDIRKSEKSGFDSPEQFVVVLDGAVFLRIAGTEGAYDVMTATTGEDTTGLPVFADQAALMNAARDVAVKDGLQPQTSRDREGRPFVDICGCHYLSDAHRVAELLFATLFPKGKPASDGGGDLRELHANMRPDGDEDVYLQDGVWLASDGTLKDRGR